MTQYDPFTSTLGRGWKMTRFDKIFLAIILALVAATIIPFAAAQIEQSRGPRASGQFYVQQVKLPSKPDVTRSVMCVVYEGVEGSGAGVSCRWDKIRRVPLFRISGP